MNRIKYSTLVLILSLVVWLPVTTYAQEMPTRYPLLELFTNTPCPICGNQDPGFFSRLADYEGDYHLVSFYPGIPYSSCIFYQANTTENTTRRNFYQIFGVPDVGINGIDFKSPNSVSTTVLDEITGGTSWLSVQVSETTGIERDVTISLEDHGGGDLETGLLFAVIVEREIMYDAPNGITLHHNVFRKFLTDVNGDQVDLSSGSMALTYQYDVDIEWQVEETYVVAWLMDPESKEVINSGTKFDEVVSSSLNVTDITPLKIYPNPVSDILYLNIPDGPGGELRIYDASGRLTTNRMVQSGTREQIMVDNWTSGTYIAEIIQNNKIYRGNFEVIR